MLQPMAVFINKAPACPRGGLEIAVPVIKEQLVRLSVFEHLPVDQNEPVPQRRWDHYVSLDQLQVHAASISNIL